MNFKTVNEQVLGNAFDGLIPYKDSDWTGRVGSPAGSVQKCGKAYFFNLVHATHTVVEVVLYNPREMNTWSGHIVKIINKQNGEICSHFFGFAEYMPGANEYLHWNTGSYNDGGSWYHAGGDCPTEVQILAYRKALANFIRLFQTSADFRSPKERGE